jgi:hypothetical protein
MDDMNAFETQVAREASREAGPSQPVDVASIVRSTTAVSSARRWSVATRWFGSGRWPAPGEGGIMVFSAVKLAAAAAIVALFGGFLLVGVVGDPQDGDLLPPAAESPSAEAVVAVPAEFSGTFTCTTDWEGGTTTNVVLGPVEGGNLVRRERRGWTHGFSAEMSDPRLRGGWIAYRASDEYFWPEGDPNVALTMAPGVMHITNDEGSWQMPWGYMTLPDPVNKAEWDGVGLLTGAGGYDGMTALFTLEPVNWPDCRCPGWTQGGPELCSWAMQGLIVDGSVPQVVVPE